MSLPIAYGVAAALAAIAIPSALFWYKRRRLIMGFHEQED